jgi:uncharacterized protein YqgC (DUF456 family)
MGGLTIEGIITVVAWILIVLGFGAIFLPFAPSVPLIWFGIFIYATGHHFTEVTRNFMSGISLIAAATIILDYTLYRFGIRRFRAGAWGVVGAIAGFIAGSFVNQFAAYVAGPILGAIIFETLRGRDQVYSFKTGNTMIGLFVLRLQGKL